MKRFVTLCCLLLSIHATAQLVPGTVKTDAPLAPTAYFLATTPVCFGTAVLFTDLSYTSTPPFGYLTTWVWDLGDGTVITVNFPNNPNIIHLYPYAGTYIVTLTVTDNFGNTDDYSSNVVTIPNPVANFMFIPACDGQPVQFLDLSQANFFSTIINWSWNFGDLASGSQNTSNLQNPSHLFSGPGSYDVTLTVTTNYYCTNQVLKQVYIAPSTGCITKTWTGAVSDDWSVPGNWNPSGLPASSDNILIPAGVTYMPKVKSNGYSCNDLTILENATMVINPGVSLTVNGNLVLD